MAGTTGAGGGLFGCIAGMLPVGKISGLPTLAVVIIHVES